jgi:hypothetical protein
MQAHALFTQNRICSEIAYTKRAVYAQRLKPCPVKEAAIRKPQILPHFKIFKQEGPAEC